MGRRFKTLVWWAQGAFGGSRKDLALTKGVPLLGWVLALTTCMSGVIGCKKPTEDQSVARVTVSTRARHLLELELTRDPSTIGPAELSSRELAVRRAAARALARNSTDSARDLLKRALSDEDLEVVAWGAFGLGRICSSAHAEPTLRSLQGRAATLLLTAEPTELERARATTLNPWHAIAQAIGRCASSEAERILRAWIGVSPALARVATFGLDSYVQVTKGLEEPTVVALLDIAEKERGLASALLPISRLPRVDDLVARRLLGVAPTILETAGVERRFLLRALPLAGQAALPVLERVAVDDSHYQPLERVDALRAIAKLGTEGQRALLRLASRLIPSDATSEALLLSARWSLIVELLEQLNAVPNNSRARFVQLAQLDVAPDKSVAVRRRVAYLRCRSAALVSENDAHSPLIEHCDPFEDRRRFKLAQIAVLSRQRTLAKQSALLGELMSDRDPVVRMAALDTWGAHPELRGELLPIRSALESESPGVVTKAARWVADRAGETAVASTTMAELGAAVERALQKPWKPDAIEVQVSLIDAAAQLGILTLKPKILEECGRGAPWVRQHAERALRRLGEPKHSCPSLTKRVPLPELEHLQSAPVGLRFHTDAGTFEIRLDPRLAPAAVTRLIDLARTGFYDGLAVHRQVPGFVIQLGDRQGDGYGGSGAPPLPCELAPQPFGPLDVGMALSGPDSASSQFFVTLGPFPQLGGEYTRVGTAGPGWDTLTIGDVIQRVEVLP